MGETKKNKTLTKIAITLLILTYIFYLLSAKPAENFGFNQNNEIALIQEMNKSNNLLNNKATKIPEKFIPIETSTKGVYKYVERMPKFINCEYMLEEKGFLCTKKYILNYAKKFKLPKGRVIPEQFTVFVKFIVNEKAYVKDVEILNVDSSELNSLVISYMKKMPKFALPGYQDNKRVKVQYVIPVTLKSNKD